MNPLTPTLAATALLLAGALATPTLLASDEPPSTTPNAATTTSAIDIQITGTDLALASADRTLGLDGFTYTSIVENQGTAPTPATTLTACWETPTTTRCRDEPVPELAPGQSTGFTLRLPLEATPTRACFTVDPNNHVNEAREQNNAQCVEA